MMKYGETFNDLHAVTKASCIKGKFIYFGEKCFSESTVHIKELLKKAKRLKYIKKKS